MLLLLLQLATCELRVAKLRNSEQLAHFLRLAASGASGNYEIGPVIYGRLARCVTVSRPQSFCGQLASWTIRASKASRKQVRVLDADFRHSQSDLARVRPTAIGLRHPV